MAILNCCSQEELEAEEVDVISPTAPDGDVVSLFLSSKVGICWRGGFAGRKVLGSVERAPIDGTGEGHGKSSLGISPVEPRCSAGTELSDPVVFCAVLTCTFAARRCSRWRGAATRDQEQDSGGRTDEPCVLVATVCSILLLKLARTDPYESPERNLSEYLSSRT